MALWTPSNIPNPSSALKMWLDGGTNSTIIEDDDSPAETTEAVKTLNSRSEALGGSGFGFTQATAGNRGVYSTANPIGSTHYVEFTAASNHYMDAINAAYSWGTAWTLVMLINVTGGSSGFGRIFDQTFDTNMSLLLNSAATGFSGFTRNTESTFALSTGGIKILTHRFVGGTQLVRALAGGSLSSDTDSATAPASATRNCRLNWDVGSGGNKCGYRLYQAVWTTDTSDDIMYRLEGYSAWLAGNGNILDAGHPYKSAAPTVGGVSLRHGLTASPLTHPPLVNNAQQIHRHQRLLTPSRQLIVPDRMEARRVLSR